MVKAANIRKALLITEMRYWLILRIPMIIRRTRRARSGMLDDGIEPDVLPPRCRFCLGFRFKASANDALCRREISGDAESPGNNYYHSDARYRRAASAIGGGPRIS